jgi:Protein of unknown function (DUF3828)
MKTRFLALVALTLTMPALVKPALAKPVMMRGATVDAVVRSVLAPYANPRIVAPNYFTAPPWTTRTRALIRAWQDAPKSANTDVTPLSEGDWLCQCQDWDSAAFRVQSVRTTKMTQDRVIAEVRYAISRTDARRLRFVMQQEGGQWRIDDLLFEHDRQSLRSQLRGEIAERARK